MIFETLQSSCNIGVMFGSDIGPTLKKQITLLGGTMHVYDVYV